jgi:hypothetical protein
VAECAVILFNSPTGSADKVNVGKLVECSVDVGQGQCPGLLLVWLVGMMVVKIQMQWGTCDLAPPICLEMWSMWAESRLWECFCLSVALGYLGPPMIGLLLAGACLENCLNLSL